MAGTNAKLLFIFFVALLSATSSYATCDPADSISLLYLVQEIGFAEDVFLTWIDGTDCCGWTGVTCNANGNVQYLHIAKPDAVVPNPVGGSYYVGSGLSTLPALVNLTFINFPLNGQIPFGWGALTNLQVLNIDGCNVVGSLPSTLCLLTGLSTLILKDNFLTGTLPSCFNNPKSSFPALNSFNISGNPMSGPIPPSF